MTLIGFNEHYLGGQADTGDYRLSPLNAKDHGNIAPAIIAPAGFDPVHDEAVMYAQKLEEAGVGVTLLDQSTLVHGYLSMVGMVPAANGAPG